MTADEIERRAALHEHMRQYRAQLEAQVEAGEVNPLDLDGLMDTELAAARPRFMDEP